MDDYVFIEKFGSNITWEELSWILFIWVVYYIAYFVIFSIIYWIIILSTHLLKSNHKLG